MEKPRILLTNDDGIRSPGLWAAAKALSELGFVHVVAPRDQSSGAGRSLPPDTDGLIRLEQVQVNGTLWDVHAVGGSPAQAVLHAIFEILPGKPDLVVSGINYGENVGSGVTISGTVGAALHAASFGIPSLAISLETDVYNHLSYSTEVDFSVAAHFTTFFGRILLERHLPPDVDVLKVDVPCDANLDTPWELTRASRNPYFVPLKPDRANWDVPLRMDYAVIDSLEGEPEDTDISALRVRRHVAVVPLSLDMTSRVDFAVLKNALAGG
jgi:5'-nucleotidase